MSGRMRYRVARPRAILAAALIACLAVAIAAAGRGWTLWSRATDGRRAREMQAERTTEFDLRAQTRKEQEAVRVNGWLSVVSSSAVTLQGARGELYATLYEPLSGEADAPLAIALHGGLGTDSAQVRDVACTLSLAGYRVLTPDLYAHGRSEGTASTLGVRDADDVRAWVDYAVGRSGGDARIVLFGQDEGALSALLYLARDPDPAVRAAALDGVSGDLLRRIRTYLGEVGAGGALHAALALPWARARLGMPLARVAALSSGEGVYTPLLLLCGTFDEEAPAWEGEDIAARAEEARVLLVEGARHGMARYVEPDAYYGALTSFYEDALREDGRM